jgi:hypothetical protein
VVIVADALHTQVAHARAVAAAGGHLYVSVKANQPTMFAQLKQLPWAQVPVGDQHRDTGHGRRETRTVKALTVQTPGGIGFPHAQQTVRITRTRTIGGGEVGAVAGVRLCMVLVCPTTVTFRQAHWAEPMSAAFRAGCVVWRCSLRLRLACR